MAAVVAHGVPWAVTAQGLGAGGSAALWSGRRGSTDVVSPAHS